MSGLGMILVGSMLGMAAYYLYPWPIELSLRTTIVTGAAGAWITGLFVQILLGFREGSMRSLVSILSGALCTTAIYIWYRHYKSLT